MAYVTPSTRTTGEIITAAIWNQDVVENVKQNPTELVTAAGDIIRGTASKAMSRLALGTAGQVLAVNGAANQVEWTSIVNALAKQKTADEQVSNSTSLQNDDHLVLAVAANTVYIVHLRLYFTVPSAANAGLQLSWSLPAGATLNMSGGVKNTDESLVANIVGITTAGFFSNNLNTSVTGFLADFWGFLTIGANAGNAQLQWAQATASSTTTIKAGSIMALIKV